MRGQAPEGVSGRPHTSASQWSSDTTIFGYVTPERLRWNLEQPHSALIWQLHHGVRPGSRDSLPLELMPQNEPKSHKRRLMSPLTAQQNKKLETIHVGNSPKAITTAPVSPGIRTEFRPSEKDYKRLMDRLEKLAANKAMGSAREQMKVGKTFEWTMEEGEKQIAFVNVKKRPIPLRVTVRKVRGKVIVFSSKSQVDPSESLCDEIHRGESITISEPGLKFKLAVVSFCFKALEDAAISVTVAFGREKVEDEVLLQKRQLKSQPSNSNLEELRLDEALRLELQEKVGSILHHRKSQSMQILSKDFVSFNKRILSPKTEERQTIMTMKAQNLTQRISTAQGRKREHIEEKKRRTLLVINRHRLRLEEEERQRKLQEQREKERICESNWLALALFAVAGGEMLARMKIRKAELQEKARRNTAAAFIQAQVRKRYRRVSGTALMETRALNSLKLAHAQIGLLMKMIAGKRILQHLRTGARNNRLQNTFSAFYRRVKLIQRLWRVYQQKEKERWKALIDLWGKVVEGLLAETNQKFPGKKGARKRQEAMDRYLGVPTSQRNTTLRSYYKSYKLEYREKVREYIRHSYHERAFKAAKAFQYLLSVKRRGSADDLLMAPMFLYLPTEEKMRELVEQTAIREK